LNIAFSIIAIDAVLCSRVTIGEAVILISDKAVVSFGLTNNGTSYTQQGLKERMFHFRHRLYF
jgi:hypothetical protein